MARILLFDSGPLGEACQDPRRDPDSKFRYWLWREFYPAVYLPITTAAMRTAARLWAQARRLGMPTSGRDSIDGDVILAAQAREYCSETDDWWVVTSNQRHLVRYLGDRARVWPSLPVVGL